MNKFFFLFTATTLFSGEFIPTVQLYSSTTLDYSINFIKKHRLNNCFVIKAGNIFTVRCKATKKELKNFKRTFPDSYFIHTKKEALNNILYPKKEKPNISSWAYLADFYYKKGKLKISLNIYKRLYAQTKNARIKTNISYIEGLLNENPSFLDETTLYAYTLGRIKNGHIKNLKTKLQNSLNLSKNGYIEFLLGYLNESDPKKALEFYQKAHEKNPNNPYFSYALGRALELLKQNNNARKIYESIKTQNEKLNKIIKNRLRRIEK